ncbi:MAG: AAA family ATPase [Gammaproteobacteria bacterium]|nr:AAA family ATPase [Gammaproteobacteria bacterium]
MIILVGGEKGGPGKTTIATNLAAMRTIDKKDTLLVDTDEQSTATYWCSLREETQVTPRVASIQKRGKSVRTEIIGLKEKYDDIIIDAGGRDSLELRGSLLVANKALFPLRPSQFDLWTLGRLNTLVEQARAINENLQAYILINQSSPNPGVREIAEAREYIADIDNLSLMKSSACERISFRRAAIRGMSVPEYKPVDQKAIDEIQSIYQEVFND